MCHGGAGTCHGRAGTGRRGGGRRRGGAGACRGGAGMWGWGGGRGRGRGGRVPDRRGRPRGRGSVPRRTPAPRPAEIVHRGRRATGWERGSAGVRGGRGGPGAADRGAGSTVYGVEDGAAGHEGGGGRDPCRPSYNSASVRRPERASAGRKDRRAGSSSPRRFRRADDGQQDRGRMGRGGALRWQSRPQWHVRLGGRCHLPGEWVGRRRRVSPATRVRREKACPTGSRTGRDASS